LTAESAGSGSVW